jgi:hypothetical protein
MPSKKMNDIKGLTPVKGVIKRGRGRGVRGEGVLRGRREWEGVVVGWPKFLPSHPLIPCCPVTIYNPMKYKEILGGNVKGFKRGRKTLLTLV